MCEKRGSTFAVAVCLWTGDPVLPETDRSTRRELPADHKTADGRQGIWTAVWKIWKTGNAWRIKARKTYGRRKRGHQRPGGYLLPDLCTVFFHVLFGRIFSSAVAENRCRTEKNIFCLLWINAAFDWLICSCCNCEFISWKNTQRETVWIYTCKWPQ